MPLWQNVNDFNNGPSLVSVKIGAIIITDKRKITVSVTTRAVFSELSFLITLATV